jgi:hypothetical protein
VSPDVTTVDIRVTFRINASEMQQDPLPPPLNRNLDGSMIPHALQEVGVSYSREVTFRTERNDYLTIKFGGAIKPSLYP